VIHGDRNPLRDLTANGLAVRQPLPSRPISRDGAARVLLGGRIMPFGVLARGGMPPWVTEDKLAADYGGAGDSGTGSSDHDDPTVASWLAAQGVTGGHLAAAAEWFRQNWAAEPQILSARGVAAARCGDQAGDGEYAFEGGYLSLAEALAGELAEAATPAIRLGQPVRLLTWAPGRVELAVGGERITARGAVITTPPPLITSGRLVIAPMPEYKAAAVRGLPAGDGLCAIAVMSRAAPESAVIFDADGHAGFVRCFAGRPEVLIVAKARAAGAVRAASLADVVARAFPWSAGVETTGVHVADWGRDPWSAGAFSYPRAGIRSAARDWAAPVSRTLFFAGEAATAGSLPPSVHGALGSGLRAAHEVVEAWGQ
jgi:monoamine oxidase